MNELKLEGTPQNYTEYTILDLEEGFRGPDNWHGKYNYETHDEISSALKELTLAYEDAESMSISIKRSTRIKILNIKIS